MRVGDDAAQESCAEIAGYDFQSSKRMSFQENYRYDIRCAHGSPAGSSPCFSGPIPAFVLHEKLTDRTNFADRGRDDFRICTQPTTVCAPARRGGKLRRKDLREEVQDKSS